MIRNRLIFLLAAVAFVLQSCSDDILEHEVGESRLKSSQQENLNLQFGRNSWTMGEGSIAPTLEPSYGWSFPDARPGGLRSVYLFARIGNAPSYNFDNIYETGWPGTDDNTIIVDFYELYNQNHRDYVETREFAFNVPGEWHFQAAGLLDSICMFVSNVEVFSVEFPDVHEILACSEIRSAMDETWDATKSAASWISIREKGFWIDASVIGGQLKFGIRTVNDAIGQPCADLEITFSIGDDTPTNIDNEGIRFAVATFHTHPPGAFCTTKERPAGFSTVGQNSDISQSNMKELPYFVYDYVKGPVSRHTPLNASADIYMTGGQHGGQYSRRPTPAYWIW